MRTETIKSIRGLNIQFDTDNGSGNIKQFVIKSSLNNGKHFMILRLRRNLNIADISMFCKYMRLKYGVKEYYVFCGDTLQYITIDVFNWIKYKSVIFNKDIDDCFKHRTLMDKFGSIFVDTTCLGPYKYYIGDIIYRSPSILNDDISMMIRENLFNVLKVNEDEVKEEIHTD